MSHIFISYSREDKNFARKIVEALQIHKMDVWIDLDDIRWGEDWKNRIFQGIANADIFVFLISPDSVESKMCNEEVTKALEYQKRIKPVYIRETDIEKIPQIIRSRNWILCRYEKSKPDVTLDNFEETIDEIIETINADSDWLRFHKNLLLKALEWEQNNYKKGFLLHGENLTLIENTFALSKDKDPQQTELQKHYIKASRIEENKRRSRGWMFTFSLGGVAICAAIACLFAAWFNYQAQQQSDIAISRRLAAQATSLLRDNYDLGLLLSVEANNISNTVDSQRSLFYASQTNPNLRAHLKKSDQAIKELSFSPNGQITGIVYEDGTIALWNVAKQNYSVLPSILGKEIFFSPDNKLLAIAGLDSGIVLWDINSQSVSQSVPDIKPEAFALTMKGNDYFLVALVDTNGDMEVIDLNDKQSVVTYNVANSNQIFFNRDGTLLISWTPTESHATYQYSEWNTLTGKQFVGPLLITLSMDFASSLTLGQNGKYFFAGGCNHSATSSIPCSAGGIDVWDGEAGKLLKHFVGHSNFIDALAVNSSNNLLASASGTNTTSDPPTIILWDVDTGERIKTLTGHSGQILGMDFSPNGKYLVSGDRNGNIMLWDMTNSSIETNNGEIEDVAYRADGKQLATISCAFIIGSCETALWDFPALQQVGIPVLSANVGPSIVAIRNDSAIAADYRDGQMVLWDLKTAKNILQLPGATSIGNGAFSSDGRSLLVVSEDNTVSLWDTGNGKFSLIQKLTLNESHSNVFSNPVFDSQGKMAALVGDASIVVANLSNKNIVYLPIDGLRSVDKMIFNPDSSLLAVSYSPGIEGTNYQTVLWNTKSGNQAMEPFANEVQPVFSSDGKYFASVDRTSGIVIRDKIFGSIVKNISQKAPETITKLFYSRNDKWLIATDSNRIYLWDVESTQSIGEFSTGGDIKNIILSPDGVTMAVAGCFEPTNRCSRGEVTFWNLNLEAWKQKACEIVGRNLTQAEWPEYIPDRPYEATCAHYLPEK